MGRPVHLKQIDFLSKNVHGYEWNPQWYILIDQLWLSKQGDRT